MDSLAALCSPTPTRRPTHLPHLSQDALKYLLNLTIKHHFITDIVCGWYEAGEDEDGGEVLVRAVTAMPLLLLRPAVTSFRCPRLRGHLKARDQLRIRCRLRTLGHIVLRHPTPTALGSTSAPLQLAQHLLQRRGLTIDGSMTTYNGYVSR